MYYVDGRWVEAGQAAIYPEDRGYNFGDGIYEVARIYQGKIYQWKEHLERLNRSATEIGMKLPWSEDELLDIVQELMKKNLPTQDVDAVLYIQITRGVEPRNFNYSQNIKPILTAFVREKARPLHDMQNGITATLVRDIRWLRCDIKTLNLLGAAMAKQQAVENGYHDAILHRDGLVTEGSASNLFAVKNGVLHTHPATNLILHGITRATVIGLAQDLGIQVIEEVFDTEFLKESDELFYTGTTTEICPIVSVDGKAIGTGKVGEVVKRLQEAFDKHIAE
ncbi:D-amino-acid transaminase [Brevibacillus dissolubilis]|uniref:D-amino-acid transaminase n=1 Tax=Brevibacillus dissolubilis TaxID=1844116 RepID=UPI00111644E7|nr:D-amino-acid transaminase [Brevibacillus dissolubilis]